MDTIVMFGKSIPAYGLLGAAGFLAGFAVILIRCKKFGLTRDDAAYIYVFAAIFAMIGAKILYLLTAIPEIAGDINSQSVSAGEIVLKYASGGFVYYGGAAGGTAGAFFSAKWFGKNVRASLSAIAPALPLLHVFGRIGCYVTGCCYGAETDGMLYTVYHASHIAPNGVHLFPVQLVEAAAELIIFIILLFYTGKKKEKAFAAQAYFIFYAPVRFILEFFRGDAARGVIFGLSTSQFIGIALFAIAVFSVLFEKRREIIRQRNNACHKDAFLN